MEKLRQCLLIAVGLAVLVLVVGLLIPGSGIAQTVKAALVANVDESGRVPYQFEGFLCIGTTFCDLTLPTVPAGKRLVVTFTSGSVSVAPQAGQLVFARLFSSTGSPGAVNLITNFQGNGGGTDFYNWSQPVLAYFNAGVAPRVIVLTNQNMNGTFHVAGYLLDCSMAPCAAVAP